MACHSALGDDARWLRLQGRPSGDLPSAKQGEHVGMLVIGCGNLLRADDAAGPLLVRRMLGRGLPDGMRCVDAGTDGIDVVFQMRYAKEVILVDACMSGSEQGTIFEIAARDVEPLSPLTAVTMHAFRWDHAMALGRWLLEEGYPEHVTAYLVEGGRFDFHEGLSPAVDRAVDRLAEYLFERWAGSLWRPAAGESERDRVMLWHRGDE